MKKWWTNLSTAQKIWIVGSTLAVLILGIVAKDTPTNILIGVVGMAYVAVYSSGVRGAFLMGVAYVGLYTIICLQNRIMLDAWQNIILIPIYIYSFIYWGKKKVEPKNLSKKSTAIILVSAVFCFVVLYFISKALRGNYSVLDAANTTCTLYAMILGMFGWSLNFILWSANNLISAVTFGLCLKTDTGSIAVFAMKCIFFINGIIGYITWRNYGTKNELKRIH